MLDGQMGRNRMWEIQDGGLLTSITYISACKQDSNEISMAILMLLGSNYQIRIVVMMYGQTGRNRQWKI